jgi:hypothetical protein
MFAHSSVESYLRVAAFVALAYNLGNFLRRFALPGEVSHWLLSGVHLNLIETGARVVSYYRRIVLQFAEVAVSAALVDDLLKRIHGLAVAPT